MDKLNRILPIAETELKIYPQSNTLETLNISEKKTKINWDYNADADVLYISFGNPKNAEGVDIGEGTIIRIELGKHEIPMHYYAPTVMINHMGIASVSLNVPKEQNILNR